MNKKKPAMCILLVAILLSAFLLVSPVVAEESGYQNISVQQAKQIINGDPNVVILDVRNQSEYDQGHLYGATLLALYQLENWDWNWTTSSEGQPYVNFLQAHANDTIVVYCGVGGRSTQACQILADHGINDVYNMEGGITAWMQAEYPIYTKNHHVSVDVVDEVSIIQIEPMLLYQASCSSCQNHTCLADGESTITNSTVTVLEESENRTLILITGEVNGTAIEYTIDTTLLARHSTFRNGVNRTMTFLSIETIKDGISNQLFGLKYSVQHEDYNLTLVSSLIPSDLETYNSTVTLVSYDPIGVVIKSNEFIEFNSSVTLSQQYKILSDVAKRLGRTYSSSDEQSLKNLADGYKTMRDEIRSLSNFVKANLSEYDWPITDKAITIMGTGLQISDPEAISNGGFESGTSYWTVGGSGDHMLSAVEYYSGSYSLLLGYKYANPVANGRDSAYQYTSIPANGYNVQFSFKYKLFTEDSANYDRLEVYIVPYGGDPQLFFSIGGSSRGGMETYGWNSWSTSLEDYRDQSIYVYFEVYNGADSSYRTYAYIDEVSITYEEVNDCDFWELVNCALSDPQALAYCTYFAYACYAFPSYVNPACWLLAGCVAVYAVGCYLAYCW
ncbi:MAG: rhodanese-like domain-containing protein [Candidatus Bathyarchaeia archaeon]